MLLGIDFGTTRTVVAAADRGNYPVISFLTESGDSQDWYPSLIAAGDGQWLFGLDAAARQNAPEWQVLRSFKRQLHSLGPDSVIKLGGNATSALDLLTRFLRQLRRDLAERSNVSGRAEEQFDVMISVPANSNNNQRFITLEAFRGAGFNVLGMVNEPSAAGIEYAHHQLKSDSPARRELVIVYDLGGGTFDASVIGMAERQHEVVSSEGIAQLGGDDFDEVLLELALEQAEVASLPEEARFQLLDECREKKEGLHPNTRRIAIDLGRAIDGAGPVNVSTSDFYARCQPLLQRTVEAMATCLQAATGGSPDWKSVASIYLVGGSSDLPVIARSLREQYGRLVRKSTYPHASTAIGLAIAADRSAGYQLRERFTRYFGVWREAEGGRSVSFDVLFDKDTLLPQEETVRLVRSRRYQPAHNAGHFRYLECGGVDAGGRPTADITPWDEILFPFDPDLENEFGRHIPIARADLGDLQVEETYACDSNGIITITMTNLTTGFSRTFRLHGSPAGHAD